MSDSGTGDDLVFRMPLSWSVRTVIALLAVTLVTVAMLLDAVGIAIMTNFGQHLSAQEAGPLVGFSLFLLLWAATVLLLLGVRRRESLAAHG